MLEFKFVSKAHKYYHFLWRQFPIHPGKCFLLPEPTSAMPCELQMGSLRHTSTLHAASCPIRTGLRGCQHLWWIVRWITRWESISEVFFFPALLLLLLLLLLERQRLFQRRGLVPRHRPAGPLGYVESSKSMSRSEREAGRRPSQLIMTLSNSLPIQ